MTQTRGRGLLRGNAPIPRANLVEYLTSSPAISPAPAREFEKFATIIAEHAETLLAMDRYERRALSRRKFAIRVLDAARRRKPIV